MCTKYIIHNTFFAYFNSLRYYTKMDVKPLISNNSFFTIQTEIVNNQNEYKDDYKIVMKQRELIRIPFLHQSPQIYYRKHMLDYLKNYTDEKGITEASLHLTVYIMDIFMDNHAILPERLHLVANVCLLLATKFEEHTANIPKLKELNAAVDNRYDLNDYKGVEIIILQFFHWYLVFPTAAHYTHYFMQAILTPQDFHNDSRTYRTLIIELHESIQKCLDKVIEDIHFMQLYTPSRLAAAIIAVARKKAGLCSWTEQLKNFTDYSKEQIYEPIQALLQSKQIVCTTCRKTGAKN